MYPNQSVPGSKLKLTSTKSDGFSCTADLAHPPAWKVSTAPRAFRIKLDFHIPGSSFLTLTHTSLQLPTQPRVWFHAFLPLHVLHPLAACVPQFTLATSSIYLLSYLLGSFSNLFSSLIPCLFSVSPAVSVYTLWH